MTSHVSSQRLSVWLHTLLAGILLVGVGLSLAGARSGRAATLIVVNSFEDRISNDNNCTLREAVIAANKDKRSGNRPRECAAGSGADTITFENPGTYLITRSDSGNEDSSATGDLDIFGDLRIEAAPGTVTIDADAISDRVFHILSGNVTLAGLTISNATVNGDGGGIYNLGTLTVEDSTISGNTASGNGGGFANASQGTLTVTRSTIDNNSAVNGGGLSNAGNTTVRNSTISDNSSTGSAGGMRNSGTLTMLNTTVSGNTAQNGGGVAMSGGTLSIQNTLIAANSATSAPDCSGTIASLGHNLIQDSSGCTLTGDLTGNLLGLNPLLGSLADNGGPSRTRALLPGSPAIDAGSDAACPGIDQRGLPRPGGAACDIGAFEEQDPVLVGPIITVRTSDDINDGKCTYNHCSLREAILAANAVANGTTPDRIHFAIPGENPPTIAPGSSLPEINDSLVIDGTTQPGGIVILDGDGAGPGASGLWVTSGASAVHGLHITHFAAHGILLETGGGNLISGNTISANGGDGISIRSGTENAIEANAIFANNDLKIDLGDDGSTPNDTGDPDEGANRLQNFPILTRAVPSPGAIALTGRLNSLPATTFSLEFYASPTCDTAGGGAAETKIGNASATTDDRGNATLVITDLTSVPEGHHITATATDPLGNTSEFSSCVRVGAGNDAWTSSYLLTPGNDLNPAVVEQFIDRPGQSRWYRFKVQPNSRVIATLTNLPANYDLTLYKDIAAAFQSISTPGDLARLGAEFAPDAFSPDAFSPDAFSPDAFSPDAFSPDAFSPDAFSPDAFSPDAFSPDAFSPDAFSPDAFSPDAFSPDAFSPDAFSPDAFSPDAFSPDAFSPDAFSSAQIRSLIAVSAFQGTAGEGISVNTWNNADDMYIRVRSANGEFSFDDPFHLEVRLLTGNCASVAPVTTPSGITPAAGNYRTLILTNLDRMTGTAAEKAELQTQLANFASRSEDVEGIVVDVGEDARVTDAFAQADDQPACPYAQNLVAGAVKEIVDGYWELNPLEYLVIVGHDDIIPFFRHPDNALLANEMNYVPPVRDSTASQASLRLGYVLSQDAYGARVELSLRTDRLPIPELAVGRLVETPADILGLLGAYGLTNNGVVPLTTSPLVTGYDFLEDGARAVQAELESGLGEMADTLIADRDLSPTDPASWTADDLRDALLGSRHDLIFLAGHFSANSALAADYSTRLTTAELIASPVDLKNAIIFSPGCHAGYNIVDEHGVPGVTRQPDWAQAFSQKGAVLIGGTGYQYGDTDFIEYSERLYLEFSRQLRTGTGPVPVGKALAAAKRVYLESTHQIRSLHEKALLQATLFGLPMLSVNMPPGGRLDPQDENSIVSATTPFATNPGAQLGLTYADINLVPIFSEHTVELTDVSDPNATTTAFYLSGSGTTVRNPAEPTLPLEVRNVSVPGTAVRGIGFRSGNYLDLGDVLPLIGAPTTEIRGVHSPFQSDVFFPIQLWRLNYTDALLDEVNGATRLFVTPSHFRSSEPGSLTGILRKFTNIGFRLYYSANTRTFAGDSTPALAAPPAITQVSAPASGDTVTFEIRVVGNPAAGIQEVWVTHTVCDLTEQCNGIWDSVDLDQSQEDSTLWTGTLALNGTPAGDIRYMVQAVNGVGLVSLATNLGAYYVPGLASAPSQGTQLSLLVPQASGPYGSRADFEATLTSSGTPVPGQPVLLRLASQSRLGITDAAGRATFSVPLIGLPGIVDVRAAFPGSSEFLASTDTDMFEITRQATAISLDPDPATGHPSETSLVEATLSDATGRRLGEKTIFFEVSGSGGVYRTAEITDFAGRVTLGDIPLPFGSYNITARFSGVIPLGEISLDLSDDRYIPASMTGELNLINHPPTAVGDSYSVDEDTTLSVPAPGVLANDFDIDGEPLTAALIDGPSSGTITLASDGSLTYTPDLNFDGVVTFTYVANDGTDDSSPAEVTLNVNPVNDPPLAVNDAYTVDEDDTLDVSDPGVLGNDNDIDGDSLTAVLDSGPNHGSLSLQEDGSFIYNPDPGYFGEDSFTYLASDGEANSDPATVVITVNQVNHPPDCDAATSSVPILWPPDNNFVSINILGITDPDGDPLTITITSIFQDERVGRGSNSPDGMGVGSSTAQVRAERDGNGDGRVYHISFSASDDFGGNCNSTIRVPVVPHDQGGNIDPIDQGPLYDSTVPDPPG